MQGPQSGVSYGVDVVVVGHRRVNEHRPFFRQDVLRSDAALLKSVSNLSTRDVE
jgi:hypothetical protein